MRICFSGLDLPIEVDPSAISVLEIHNRTLFARVCASLVSEAGTYALEPYSLWDDTGEPLRPSGQMLFVESPLQLPWDDRALAGALAKRMERLIAEDETTRKEVEDAFNILRSRVSQIALQLESDYSFGVDWELKRYLKSFGFGVDIAQDEALFDKLIKFLRLARDALLSRPILFMNLKLFLSENDLNELYRQAFFSNLSLLLIENVPDEPCRAGERKYTIDQDFLESCKTVPADLPVLPQ